VTKPVGARERRADALPVLIAYVVVLMGIPSELILRPLGAAGTPAQVMGIGMLAWWLASRLVRQSRRPLLPNPIKTLLMLFVVSILVSYLAGMTRPITFGEEVSSADRALLSLCAWAGVTLVIVDGISSRKRLDAMLKVVAGSAAIIAVLGMLQFFFKIDLAHYIRIPGLSANHAFGQLLARSKFQRVTGTTSHPIEFGVVLSCTLPLLIHYARFGETQAQRRRWWLATAAVAAVLPMSVARSAILGAAIAVVYLFYTWPGWLRTRVSIAIILGAGAMSFVVPGLLGTIRGLFLNASSDPSTAGRTADYAPVIHYVAMRPLFGQGIGTYIPSIYRTLDNQYLGTVVECGIVGLLALLALFIGSICAAGAIRRRATTDSTKDLAQCLKAGLAVIAVNSATFDTFGFSMAAGMIFLFVGSIGALWKLPPRPQFRPKFGPSRKRMVQAAAVAYLLVVALVGALVVQDAKPEYQAYGNILLVPPTLNQGPYATAGRADYAASVLHDILLSSPIREKLTAKSVHHYEVALQGGSLAAGTDIIGTGGPALSLLSTGATADQANSGLVTVLAEARLQLADIQNSAKVDEGSRIQVEVLRQSSAFTVYGRPSRAKIVLLILLLLLGAVTRNAVRRQFAHSHPSSSPPPPRAAVPALAGSTRVP
jgi:O-antigen ligase